MKKKVIICLVCLLLFTACTKGENNPSTNNNSVALSKAGLSDEVPEAIGRIGNSKAMEINPVEGLVITAEENALYADTSFRVIEVEYDERMESVDEYLKHDDIYAYAAYEIDAGLKADEYLPEGYKVAVDLDTLDIDSRLYDSLTAYRIDEDGNIYEYVTEIVDNHLVFESAQNSLLIVGGSITIAGLIIYGAESERSEAEAYFDKAENTRIVKDGKASGGKYRIIYSPSDMGAQYRVQMARFAELCNTLKNEAEREYEEEYSINNYSMFGFFRNKDKAKFIEEKINANKEVQTLAEELKKPKGLEVIEERIKWAFNYLDVIAKVKMPRRTVDFYIQSGVDDLGEEKSGTFRSSYIVLKADSIGSMLIDGRGDEDKDDLLLTITHELFHVCQERYHIGAWKLTNNTKFDEALALTLEADAKRYYTENCYITTDPELTKSEYWEDMIIPIDENPNTGDAERDNNICIHQGYFFSKFIEYLRDEVRANVTVKDIMDTRNYLWKTNITEPLMKAFDISEAEFDSYFRNFFVTYKKDYDERYRAVYGKFDYPQREAIKLVENGKVKIPINNRKSYHSEMQSLVETTNKKTALLLMLNYGIIENHPEITIVPLDKYKRIKNGCFIGEENYYQTGEYHNILEIFGKTEDSDKDEAYYHVYSLNPLATPKTEIKNDKLIIKISEKSEAGKDGYLVGYGIKVVASDGKTTELYLTYEEAEKGISLPLSNLCFKPKDKNNERYEVCYCEYLLDNEGAKLTGPYSEYTTSGNDELVWVLEELRYKAHEHYVPETDKSSDKKCVGPNGEEVACVYIAEDESTTQIQCSDTSCVCEYCLIYDYGTICEKYVTDVGNKIYRNNEEVLDFMKKECENVKYCILYSDEKDTMPDYYFVSGGKIVNPDKFIEKVPKFEQGASFILEIGEVKRKYVCKTLSEANATVTKHVTD